MPVSDGQRPRINMPKGKPGTKGQKAIVIENEATIKFYVYIMAGACIIYLLPTFIFFWDSFTALYITLTFLACGLYAGSYKFMSSMAKASYDPNSGALLDGGIDLNYQDGMAENVKDLILLTAGTQCLSLISNYFWLILLLAPGRAFYMLWVNILSPWFFAEPPEVDEKKTKKAERKMKKMR